MNKSETSHNWDMGLISSALSWALTRFCMAHVLQHLKFDFFPVWVNLVPTAYHAERVTSPAS